MIETDIKINYKKTLLNEKVTLNKIKNRSYLVGYK